MQAQEPVTARTPATPLVLHDPYFSVWSFNDALTDGPTRHWTGTHQQMSGLVRIDGKTFRFLGDDRDTTALKQVSRAIWPTRTIYDFEDAGIHLTLTFFTPALPQDLDILSRPVTYVSWDVRSTDGQPHNVSVYFDATAQLATNTDDDTVVWGRERVGDMQALRIGTNAQPVLAKSGDNLRIDWGWFYLAVPPQPGTETAASNWEAREQFAKGGSLPTTDDLDMPAAVKHGQPLLAVRFDLGSVGSATVSRRVLLAYDDRFSIEYLNRKLRAYWRRNGMTTAEMLEKAESEESSLRTKAETFDKELVTDLTQQGGSHYAQLATLAFRQTIAAHKLVTDVDGKPMLFSKENFSNGCIDTVDVTYPSAPFFLLLNPKLLQAQLDPMLEYASLPRWRWPFAPHDLGQYPLANGQVYGGGERTEEDQMPVEESGNLIILTNALAHAQGSAAFAEKYWPVLTKWAEYLKEKGLDPENQLSTDDFAGHLPHNTNLSIKAIDALGSYAQLAEMLGKKQEAAEYRKLAQQMAAKWKEMAVDGDHYKLAFDQQGSWSQKYNLVWDRVLGLHLFSPQIVDQEMAFYLKHQNEFGLPLDNRKTYTKLDWIVWTATLSDKQSDFIALTDPLYKYMTESPTRVPLSDWFETTDGRQVGFQARSVVGGVYMKMLADPAMWKKWASMGK
ncbi:glutaminase family protein [Acidobacterium sp. S8]|uniref:glutaminase family protein n=1 Tax=Acidobacterium sp. S8 TaxID=1641854 RepID=UPI0020B12632|nr:glutaminase family protein [Acidobacterium sp. S8]